jgi:hypothetical protein
MFWGKARSLLKSGAPKRCFILTGTDLTRKYKIRLERTVKDKPVSLFGPFVSYKEKSFVTMVRYDAFFFVTDGGKIS